MATLIQLPQGREHAVLDPAPVQITSLYSGEKGVIYIGLPREVDQVIEIVNARLYEWATNFTSRDFPENDHLILSGETDDLAVTQSRCANLLRSLMPRYTIVEIELRSEEEHFRFLVEKGILSASSQY